MKKSTTYWKTTKNGRKVQMYDYEYAFLPVSVDLHDEYTELLDSLGYDLKKRVDLIIKDDIMRLKGQGLLYSIPMSNNDRGFKVYPSDKQFDRSKDC